MENIGRTLTREELTPIHDTSIPEDGWMRGYDYMASVLFHILLQVTKGAAYTVTRTTVDDNGFDTLRLLQQQFWQSEEAYDDIDIDAHRFAEV